MLFNSLTFLVFFIVVFTLHQFMPTWGARKAVLLVGSYLFYAAWNPPYVFILLFSTAVDWWLARQIWRSQNPSTRKALVTLSLVANLGMLGFFKYGGFLLENFHVALHAVGIDYVPPVWSIVLPVGISFYTFASLSYTIDVYRREIEADTGFLDYALFVSFFPHLVAGPIIRAKALLPQIEQPRQATTKQVGWGMALVVFGLFSKVVIADNVFAPVADLVYAAPDHYAALDTWAAVLGFSGQIYYDFSGYSLCAIGLALTFGFSFPDNFRHPYAARGFSDFWRRWHISLSSWLRDYLYVPLGGNRSGPGRTYVNIMLTMLIGGLWHGASWMFALWGGLHGSFLVAERWLRRHRPADAVEGRESLAAGVGVSLLTFLLVTLTWIPFRAPDLHTVGAIVSGLGRAHAPDRLDLMPMLLCYGAIAATLLWHFHLRDSSIEERLSGLRGAVQMAMLAACLVALFLVSGGDERAFLYFQF